MEHLDTTLNRIGRLRGLKRLIVGDFVGFQVRTSISKQIEFLCIIGVFQ